MSTVDTAQLSPNELRLHIAQTRERLEHTVEELRGKLDFRAHYYRVAGSLRRDWRDNPTAFVSMIAGITVIGAVVVAAVVVGDSDD